MRVCLRVCPPPRLLITSGVMWYDTDPHDWLNKFYGFYMAAVVGIGNWCSILLYMLSYVQCTCVIYFNV